MIQACTSQIVWGQSLHLQPRWAKLLFVASQALCNIHLKIFHTLQLHTLTQPSIFKGVVTTYGLPSSAGTLGKLATVAVWSPAAYFKTQRLLAENIMIASVASEINLWGWLAKNFITHIHSFQSLIPFQLLGNYFEENCLLADKKTSENIDYELTFTEVKSMKMCA